VQDVSFSVEIGEKLAIIGPNGAGKTTLFNLLNGQFKASDGRIYLFNQDITNISTQRRAHLGQARSFQMNTLFPTLTVLDNMQPAVHVLKPSRFHMFRSITSYDDHITKAQKLLETMALWEKREDLAQDISYGEQRKLEIAFSLASEPKLMLLDEPSEGLAPIIVKEVGKVINRLKKRRIPILLVEQNPPFALKAADYVYITSKGLIVYESTPDELKDDVEAKGKYLGVTGR